MKTIISYLVFMMALIIAVYWIFPITQEVIAVVLFSFIKRVVAFYDWLNSLYGALVLAVVYISWKIDGLKK